METKPNRRRVLGLPVTELTYRRWRVFLSDRKAVVCSWLLILIVLLSVFAPFIANDRPLLIKYKGEYLSPVLVEYPETKFGGFLATTDYRDSFIAEEIQANGWMVWPPVPYHYRRPAPGQLAPPEAPTWGKHWFGTDENGRDVVARLLYGVRISIAFGFMYAIFTSAIGITAGALMGYFGGWVDLVFQRILEIYGSLPQLFILILLASVIVPGFWSLMAILVIFGWTGFVGIVRAEFLRARNFDYIRAAKALGVRDRTVIWRHVFPNAMIGPITFIPFTLAGSVTVLSSLDFLGFGMPPGSPSLGEMVSQALANIRTAPHLAITIFFGLGILTTLLVFIGEGVRNAFDPRKGFGT